MVNPTKLQDRVPVIMKVIDLMSYREASGGRNNTSNVPDCIRFAICNIGNYYIRQVCRNSGDSA